MYKVGTPEHLKAFVQSYLTTAEWADKPEGDKEYTFTRVAVLKAANDCQDFINRVITAFGIETAEKILTQEGNDLTYLAPHDFWLTRNGHGAGFFDKEIWDEITPNGMQLLTDICKHIGETYLYTYGRWFDFSK